MPLVTGGHADDLARTSIARSCTELHDTNKLTIPSLAAALEQRALQLHPKEEATLFQGKHDIRDLRAALLGDREAPEGLVTATRHFGSQWTIEGTTTTERVARCAAARPIVAVLS